MACPHVAGAVALIKQDHPDWSPQKVKASLTNTAYPLKNSLNKVGGALTQGAGRIDVYKAIHTNTFVHPGSVSFGYLQKDSGVKLLKCEVCITNQEDANKVYNLDVKINSKQDNKNISVMVRKKVDVSQNTTQIVPIRIKVDTNNLPRGIYSGLLRVNERNLSLRIPFVVLLEPRRMAFIDALRVVKKGERKFELSYYLPFNVDRIEIIARTESNEKKKKKSFAIYTFSKTRCKKGFHRIRWSGNAKEGKRLLSGQYTLDARVMHQGRIYVVSRAADNYPITKKVSDAQQRSFYLA